MKPITLFLKLNTHVSFVKYLRCMVFQWKKRWIFSTHQICYLYSKKEWQTCIVEAKSILQKRYGVNTKNNKKPKGRKKEVPHDVTIPNSSAVSADTIFAFLTLNTMSSAHEEIFGAKFSSFERLEL